MKTTDVSSLTKTELELTRAIVDAIISTSYAIDKVSTWLLAGLGATIALIVANLDKTSSFMGVENIRMVLMILMIAGLLGIAEKYLAILVHNHLRINPKINDVLNDALESHKKHIDESGSAEIEFDPMKSMLKIQEFVPWYQRREYNKSFQCSLKDPLHGHKRAARFFNYQTAYAILQLILSVAAIFIIAINVKPA